MFITANNGHVLVFDNVSGLPTWISDMLCRLSTGGGFAVRQLFTDQDEVLFDATRPVILNGIEDLVTRPDLADRALLLTLEPIPEEQRRPEAEIWTAFEAEHPRILGALLDAVVVGLRRLPEIRLPRLPRMADFALWATACEAALWPSGAFWLAYAGNLAQAVDAVIEADPVASAVRALMKTWTEWKGTASQLLTTLELEAGERAARSKAWPQSSRALSGRLRRAATALRRTGVDVVFEREGHERTRTVIIRAASSLSANNEAGNCAAASSASEARAKDINSVAANGLRTQNQPGGRKTGDADAKPVRRAVYGRTSSNQPSAPNSLEALPSVWPANSVDDADASSPTHFGPREDGIRTEKAPADRLSRGRL